MHLNVFRDPLTRNTRDKKLSKVIIFVFIEQNVLAAS